MSEHSTLLTGCTVPTDEAGFLTDWCYKHGRHTHECAYEAGLQTTNDKVAGLVAQVENVLYLLNTEINKSAPLAVQANIDQAIDELEQINNVLKGDVKHE